MKGNILASSNKKFILKLFTIIGLFLFSASFSYAASGTPTIISYQGRLANASGDLLGSSSGTTYYFAFSLWDAASNGNKLWPSGNPATTTASVRQGVFNANIGDTDNGYPDSLNYNFNTNKDIYLEVKVSSDNSVFQTLSPRQRLASSAFSQLASAVSGTGQSSFGTTTPVSNAVVTIEATTTSAIPALIRASAGQLANLFRIEDSSLNHLFSVNSLGGIFASSTFAVGTSDATSFFVNDSGKVGVGTTSPTRKFNIFDADSVPQLRLGQTDYPYGEFYVDSSGDLRISSNSGSGGNIRQNDENLWICSGGGCDAGAPSTKGNVIVETSIIFDNNFVLKQIDASTTRMYDTTDSVILEFDEGE